MQMVIYAAPINALQPRIHLLALQRRARIRPKLRMKGEALELVEPRKLGVVRCVIAEVSAAHVEHAASQSALIFCAIFICD